MNTQSWLAGSIAQALILVLLLNPLAHGVPQEPAATQNGDRKPADTGSPQAPDPNAPITPSASTSDSSSTNDQLPDSPSTSQTSSAQNAAPTAPQTSAPQTQEPAPAQPQSQNPSREPLGTAAAETVPTSGVAASRPAGAALAPAKQRRIRSILIKTGALVGIGVAIGATMALSQGSPSKPPGAH